MSLARRVEDRKVIVQKAQASYRPHKRPKIVLEEDEYIDGLSKVIRHNFFPGLEEFEEEEQGLSAQIYERPGSTQKRSSGNSRSHTPLTNSLKGPSDVALGPGSSIASGARRKDIGSGPDTNLTLECYQAKYTSEDNASFLDILDRTNLRTRERYAWHYNNNKVYSDNVERHELRIAAEREAEKLQVGWIDDRPAVREGWKVQPKNALMFQVDPSDAVETGHTSVKTISYSATRLPPEATYSESASNAILDVREEEEEDEPRVNGFTFIEEPDSPQLTAPTRTKEAHNPFKIAETPARDQLLERMTRNRRPLTASRTPHASMLGKGIATPKFKSSPILSPAAHRLLAGKGKSPGTAVRSDPFGAGDQLRDRLRTPHGRSKLK